MNKFNASDLKDLYIPAAGSHKGENGKVLIIGGSVLFHAASLWALQVSSRIVDMVFYSSVPENNALVEKEKAEFRNGIIVPRNRVQHYIEEADCVLIGPGLPRVDGVEKGDDDTKKLTETLFREYPNKKWVVDGGSLQVINPKLLPQNAILTPHHQEFKTLFKIEPAAENVQKMALKFNVVILLKGEKDYISDGAQIVEVAGGNAGMTKGGTGDVLAGLVAAFYAKNKAFLAAEAASFINKKAGESLAAKMGLYFNASDLTNEIPVVMKEFIS
jgi:NAD(P)H-hydrate epimerase